MSFRDKMKQVIEPAKFEHALFPKLDIERVDTPEARYYRTPEGNMYKSVTTRLGEIFNKEDSLQKWRDRIGEEEANKITSMAATRGTQLHNMCEQYLLNQKIKDFMPTTLDRFKKVKPVLDNRVGCIFGIEHMMYSDYLETAGTTDVLAEFDGLNSVIDFKTARGVKKEEWIESYFVQASVYATMAEDLYFFHFPQIVIIIVEDHGPPNPQVFVRQKIDRTELKKIF